ncbi:MAG: immunoglobulin domain-containing protein [Candidatus Didemnitutus sp.]|nr:immunoglobulin domain-containing protein [Candidatus Didemnitutus sp.]
MSNKLRLALLAAAAAFAAGGAALAYDIIRDNGRIVKWPAGTVTYQLKLGSTRTLQDGTNFNSSFTAAMNSWNAVIARVQLAGTVAAEGVGGRNNGISEVFFAPNIYGESFGESTVAITSSFRSGEVQADGSYPRTQSDIIFNSNRSWDSYRGPRLSQSSLDFRRVAIHELGHSLGLDHPDEAGQSVSAIMNSRVSDVDALRPDDIDGAQFLYGSAGTIVRPPNNDFAGATAITLLGNAATVTGSSVNANKEAGEPNHAPSEPGGASIWWRWTANASGSISATTAGSNFDTLLASYTGSSVSTLTQLAANDDVVAPADDPSPTRPRTSRISFNVTSGTTYYLAVDGWEGEWGSVQLNVTFSPTPVVVAPVITAQPQSQTVTAGSTVTFSVTAAGSPTPTYQWFRGTTSITNGTAASYTIISAQAADAGDYTVRVTNSGGSVTSDAATLTVNAAPTPPPTPTPTPAPSGGGGGGGAPSLWALAALVAASALRAWQRQRG